MNMSETNIFIILAALGAGPIFYIDKNYEISNVVFLGILFFYLIYLILLKVVLLAKKRKK